MILHNFTYLEVTEETLKWDLFANYSNFSATDFVMGYRKFPRYKNEKVFYILIYDDFVHFTTVLPSEHDELWTKVEYKQLVRLEKLERIMEINIDTTLEELANKRFILSGVDRETQKIYDNRHDDDDSQVIRFKLDNQIYMAVEDNNDGYRSAMGRIFISNNPKDEIKYKIPDHEVITKMKDDGSYQNNDTLQFIDVLSNEVVLEVGTDNWDDYYPLFMDNWTPENLAINKEPKLYNKTLRLKKLERIIN